MVFKNRIVERATKLEVYGFEVELRFDGKSNRDNEFVGMPI